MDMNYLASFQSWLHASISGCILDLLHILVE